MKILQIMAGGYRGGAETAFVDMCVAMHASGQTIEVITRSNDLRVPALRSVGICVHTLPFGGVFDIFTTWRMKSIIKRFKPDIVQSWMSRASWKIPKWSSSMGIPRYITTARLGGYYKLKYFKSIEYFTTITPDIKTYLVKKGINTNNVRHINNFAETESSAVAINRADYDTPQDSCLLLGLGRLHPSKAFDTLIKAVSKLPDNVYLWIAGEGPQRSELASLIKKLNVEKRVKLLGWRNDRAALFQAADICVFSSRYEPFGTVFVQSWAQNTPLITTRSDGPRQFVNHEKDGLVIDIDDENALCASVKRLINDPSLAQKIVRNGHTRYTQEFTKQICLENYLNWYQKMRENEGL